MFNLSFEEHLLRSKPNNTPVCFIYRNAPCIVIGRNQNPWKELNIEQMRKRGLALVRRRSGGGAVFHDYGNTNFSFHVPRTTFARRTHAELVARALNGPDVGLRSTPSAAGLTLGQGHPDGAYVNDRNDLCVRISVPDTGVPPASAAVSGRPTSSDGTPILWSERKISGSAFKILTHRAYHHGTMLLSSNLADLGSSLRNTKAEQMVSKGVESVRSSVINLSEAYPSVASRGLLAHDAFTSAVINEFWKTYSHLGRDDLEASDALDGGGSQAHRINVTETFPLAQEEKRVKLEQELGTWDWVFGQCPEFETELDMGAASQATQEALLAAGLKEARVWLRCKGGVIEQVEVRALGVSAEVEADALEGMFREMQQQRYDAFTDRPPLPAGAESAGADEDARLRDVPRILDQASSSQATAIAAWLREAM